MRILLLNWRDPENPLAGGAEYVTHKHAASWVKNGHTVTWFASHFSGARKSVVIDGITTVRRGNKFTLFLHVAYYYFLNRSSIDVVVDEIHGIPFFTPLYVRKPIVAFIHEVAGEIWDYSYPFPLNIIGRITERVSLQLYKNVPIWTDAKSTVDDLKKMGINPTHCVPIFCPIENEPVKKLPQKEKDPTFLFVSRLVPMKGVEDIIEAFYHINQTEKKARLWIVGQGDTQFVSRLKQSVRRKGIAQSVVFFDFVSQKKKLELMSKATLLLHGSVKEGWGLVVLESASQGTPTVAYNVAGLRDTVQHSRTGILVEKRDPFLLAKEALSLVASNNRYRKMQHAGLRFVRSLKWSTATEKSMQLLKATLN